MNERIVKLTDEQHDKLQETFDWSAALTDQLVAVFDKLAEKRAKSQRDAWETVRRLVAQEVGEKVTIDWVNRCVVVEKQEIEPVTWRAGANQLDSCLGKTIERLRAEIAEMKAERAAAIVVARSICRGADWDADWPDNLHMADVIEKRIYNMALNWRKDSSDGS